MVMKVKERKIMKFFLILLICVSFSYEVQSDDNGYVCSIDIDAFIYRQNIIFKSLLDRQLAQLVRSDFHKDTLQVLNKELNAFMQKQSQDLSNFRKMRSEAGCQAI